ncbi:MAG: 26S proteasome non-ATPase regulatory subunit 3 [Marteilia pararefringens]
MLPSKLQEIPIEDIEKYTDSKNLKSSQVLDSEDNTTNVSAMEKSSIDPCAADKTPKEVISAENRKFRLTFNCSSFLGIVLAYRCYDSKQYELGANLCELIMKCVANGGHIFSLIAEKAFFMFALMHEKLGSLTAQRFLLQQYLSFSMKRKQYAHQSILINAILRSYISVISIRFSIILDIFLLVNII